jgi:hypothetical protein
LTPAKVDGKEPVITLLNYLVERREYVDNVILKTEKNDSG